MPAPSTVLYRRDLLGRLVAAGTSADPRAYGAWSYRGDGALATETLKAVEGAMITRSFAHDGLGRPVSIDEPALTQTIAYRKDGDRAKPYADGGIAAETIAYKAAGFPSGTIPPSSTTSYTYDGFGRLTTARSGERSVLNVDASYDGNGNLDSLVQAGASRTYVYHDGTNRLDTVRLDGALQDYTHDAAGAVTNAAGTGFVRDPASGRMRRGSKGGQSLSVLRDGRGRIVLTIEGTAKRLALRDGAGAILVEREGTSLSALHLHGAAGRIALWNGTAQYAVSKDLRGSTRLLYGADGKAAAWLSYCAYGALDTLASSSNALTVPIRQRYTGQDWLESLGLYDYGARLYDPAQGRFLSPDPKDETPSPYMYVAGDPVNGVDPDGEGRLAFWIKIGRERYFFTSESKLIVSSRGGTKSEVILFFVDLHKSQNIGGFEMKGFSLSTSPYVPIGTSVKDLDDLKDKLEIFWRKERLDPRIDDYPKEHNFDNSHLPFEVPDRTPEELQALRSKKREYFTTHHHRFTMHELRELGYGELEIRIMKEKLPPVNPLWLNLRGLGRRAVTNVSQIGSKRQPFYMTRTAISEADIGALLFPSKPVAPPVKRSGPDLDVPPAKRSRADPDSSA